MHYLHIVPAIPGWHAVFACATSSPENPVVKYAVACWGLLDAEIQEEEDEATCVRETVGLIAKPGEPFLTPAIDYEFFLGYLGPGSDPFIFAELARATLAESKERAAREQN